DLGFWNMYPEEATEEEIQQIVVEEKVEEEPFADGNHIELILRDGTSEWVPIDSNLEKNSYDFSNLVSKNNIYKYYANGKQASFFGINLSRYEKDVNFNLLKNAGVDYVMIRVGARGYATGELQIDDTFSSQMEAAKEIGMPVGVYFASQAITKEEAVQEAELVLAKIAEYDISYPVVFQMEYVDNDEARIETLTQNERTQIALAFLDRISSAGYTPMLYGDKDWLLKRIDLTKLEKYDIWISIQEDVPDYPYLYSMWLYSKQGKISGVSSEVEFNICFIDYSAR
ncbi:MAG: glycoside hydrolase family 25 protein, partial [Lachnospiraceae bacterium]